MADVLKDSGKVREFPTGAHRDAADGKGRCDLLPLDVVATVLKSETLRRLYEFSETLSEAKLNDAIYSFAAESKVPVETVLLEASKQYEDGAKKYGANNWKLGIPCHVYLDSAARHYIKWHRGDSDEPHDRAFLWNVMCLMWTLRHVPDMNDLPKPGGTGNSSAGNTPAGAGSGAGNPAQVVPQSTLAGNSAKLPTR